MTVEKNKTEIMESSSVSLNLCGRRKLMLRALAATESRSLLPVSKTFQLYSITSLVPTLILTWPRYELEQRNELVAG